MNPQISHLSKPTLEDVAEKYDYRRKNRKKRSPIPEELWEAAVGLTDQYASNVIANRLRLSPTGFKERVRQSMERDSLRDGMGVHFVEIPAVSHLHPLDCELTMESPSGATMKILFKGGREIDFLEWGKLFWSQGR